MPDDAPSDAEPILIHRVIARLNVGGPAMHVVNLARAFQGGSYRTRLIVGSVPEGEGDMEYYAAERGVEVTRIPEMSREIRPWADARTVWRLWRIFRRDRPDIVHTHTAKAGTLGRLAAMLARVPVRIHTYHGHVLGGSYFSPAKTRLFLEIERQLARVTDRLVVLTRRQAREMTDELRVAPPDRFAVVPLGLELERFATLERARARAAEREALGIPAGVRVVGIVGRLVPVKNHELFLEAVRALRDSRRRTPLVALVVGGGERETELRARAERMGLGGVVRWLGWRRDLPGLYAAMDVLALTSHDEGTPVAVIEALAAGTPVVARDVGGVAEVLEACGAGRLVPAGAGGRAWAEALAEVLRGVGAPAATPLDDEVRGRVVDRFSVQRLAADLEGLYRQALAEHRP